MTVNPKLASSIHPNFHYPLVAQHVRRYADHRGIMSLHKILPLPNLGEVDKSFHLSRLKSLPAHGWTVYRDVRWNDLEIPFLICRNDFRCRLQNANSHIVIPSNETEMN